MPFSLHEIFDVRDERGRVGAPGWKSDPDSISVVRAIVGTVIRNVLTIVEKYKPIIILKTAFQIILEAAASQARRGAMPWER